MSGECVEVSFTRNCREDTRISCKPFWYMVSCPCRATDKAKPQTELRTYGIIFQKRKETAQYEIVRTLAGFAALTEIDKPEILQNLVLQNH